jgi:hypothetical protein
MPRVQRTAGGHYRLRLPREERELLRSLLVQLRELLATEDPALRRLRPLAHPDDPELERRYRELVGDELDRGRMRTLSTMAETVDAQRLDEEQMAAWLHAVNDLRLVLGTRLDVTEGLYEEGLPEDDPRSPSLAIYAYLGWLQEQVVEAMGEALPPTHQGGS